MSASRQADPALGRAVRVVRNALARPGACPEVVTLFHEASYTATHIVSDPSTGVAAIIDPALDYDHAAGRIFHETADRIVEHVKGRGLTIAWILETHIHADHLSSAHYLKGALGGQVAIGCKVTQIQDYFGRLFHEDRSFDRNGRQFDRLLEDGDALKIGSLDLIALHVPGHTPVDMAYVVGDAVFAGDTIFMPDYGTARADFPGGDAHALYGSIRRLLSLPREARLFVCHDYKAPGRDAFAWQTTIGAERDSNIHVHDGVAESEFVALRKARDEKLGMPALILPSIQVNMRGGDLPAPEDNGRRYLRIPLNAL